MAWRDRARANGHLYAAPDGRLPDARRIARLLTRRSIGVVLGGGGARGFAHLGLFRALEELDIPVDVVGGSSMGAYFAGLKAVGESVEQPLRYYRTNLDATFSLVGAMADAGVRTLVFSSSATVYGAQASPPFEEDLPTSATNPYGWTKVMQEQVLRDVAAGDPRWRIALLRYFNPVGAHPSGLLGEDPLGAPANLMPYVSRVASGEYERLQVFGADFPTRDGSAVREFIHVMDLADGHVKALAAIAERGGLHTWNLGTGNGYSVLEVRRAFEEASGREIPYEIVDRRPGDVAVSYADPSAALADLGWSAERDLAQMCADHWNWQKTNPEGYPAA